MGKHKEKSKKHKREKKHKKRRKSSSDSSSSSEDEWVEKSPKPVTRDDEKPSTSKSRPDWMSLPTSFLSESHLDRRKDREENKRLERERAKYNPKESVRELNPYWKDGGDGLPKFKEPSEDSRFEYKSSNRARPSSSWRKKESTSPEKTPPETIVEEALTDKEMNILASKLVKAEIMGNTKLVQALKEKLENARKLNQPLNQPEDVLLTQTDSKGFSRPVKPQSQEYSRTKKKQKVETHKDGERVRYFADDDKQSLQQMFENEKYNSVEDQNNQFIKLAGRIHKNDDLDEIFTDNIRQKESDSKTRDRAINEHHKISHSLDNCKLCLQSEVMIKHLMVSLGETVFLSLPSHEPLTSGHCLIIPIRHVTCSTQLDENEWSDIMDLRKALTRMFTSQNKDVVFFETAKNLDKYPHMFIECVPVDKEEGDLAPIYFKKAIDECETEWAQNKKLVSLKNKDVRRAIPKGLPYFFVSFGMDEGFAHVIEEQKYFPSSFAQEIIAGMLDLHHSKWKRPRHESFEEQSQRVVEFSKQWSDFDCTNKM